MLNSDPQEAVRWAGAFADDPDVGGAVSDALASWAEDHPAEALRTVEELPPCLGRSLAIEALQARHLPEGTSEPLHGLEGIQEQDE